VSSCATKRQYASWQDFPPAPFFYRYEIGDISVVINHVLEVNIIRQLLMITETHLDSRQNFAREGDKIIFLYIFLEQRSFM
jgi:hypothetical protein